MVVVVDPGQVHFTDEEDRKNHLTRAGARTHVGVELADEAGEVGVLEVRGQERLREDERVGDDEAVAVPAPRDDGVGGRVVHHAVRLGHERRHAAGRVHAGAAGRHGSTVHY